MPDRRRLLPTACHSAAAMRLPGPLDRGRTPRNEQTTRTVAWNGDAAAGEVQHVSRFENDPGDCGGSGLVLAVAPPGVVCRARGVFIRLAHARVGARAARRVAVCALVPGLLRRLRLAAVPVLRAGDLLDRRDPDRDFSRSLRSTQGSRGPGLGAVWRGHVRAGLRRNTPA